MRTAAKQTPGHGAAPETTPLTAGDAADASQEALVRRLIRLEENAFFQEERLKALDAALTDQQRQLDALERQLAQLRAITRALRDKLADSPEDALPPHFMPERY